MKSFFAEGRILNYNLLNYCSLASCGLLNSTNKTNKKLGIFVNKILEGSKEGDDPPNLEDPFYKKAYTHPKDWTKDESKKFRVNCTTSVEILGHGAPNMFEYTFQLDCKPLVIILESQRKNGWGNWINYHGEYNVSGLAGVIIEEGTGGIGQPPTNTQPYYPDFMLNFQTIHGNTGSTFFPKTLNQNMVYYNGIVWTSVISKVFYCPANINPIHYDITADIAGGVHGIHVHNIFQ